MSEIPADLIRAVGEAIIAHRQDCNIGMRDPEIHVRVCTAQSHEAVAAVRTVMEHLEREGRLMPAFSKNVILIHAACETPGQPWDVCIGAEGLHGEIWSQGHETPIEGFRSVLEGLEQ